MASDTRLLIADLRENTMQLGVPQGRVNLDLRRRKSEDTVEVDLSRGAVWLLEPGIYDIDSGAPDQSIRITVFVGSVRFVGGGIDQTVSAGLRLILTGTDTLTAATEAATEDDFSKWCRAHDYHPEQLAAPYHVSPEMTGYEELDSYGQWATEPQYGTVWYPQWAAAGWTPYSEGHWVWIEPWGWNWVDDEPWGFAPFHYGRWALIAGRWAWVAGEFVPEPVFAPALVAFLSLPAAAGSVLGWFPLAPGEVYWPIYLCNTRYIQNINITNVNIVTIRKITRMVAPRRFVGPPRGVVHQRFANRGSAVFIPVRAFATAARVAPATVTVPSPLLQGAAVTVHPPLVVAPTLRGTVATTRNPAGGPPPSLARPHGPTPPNFGHLDPAPRVTQAARAAAAPGRALPATNAARQVPQPVTSLPQDTGKRGATEAGKPPVVKSGLTPHPKGQKAQPVAATRIIGRPSGPPGPPDFAHLAPARPTPGAAPVAQRPAAAAGAPARPEGRSAPPYFGQATKVQGGAPLPPQASGHAATPPAMPAQATAGTPVTTDKAAEEARRTAAAQQRAAEEASARQQAAQAAVQQRAAQEVAARRQAAQAAAQQEAAARQQAGQAAAQQRAAQEASARQQAAQAAVQQRAAQEVAARRQAAQAAAQQEAAARQQAAQAAAQQRAAQEAVARQQAAQAAAQRRAAQEAVARQQAAQAAVQQRAAQEVSGRQAYPPTRPACGQPGQLRCGH
jgi:hypothetical protein